MLPGNQRRQPRRPKDMDDRCSIARCAARRCALLEGFFVGLVFAREGKLGKASVSVRSRSAWESLAHLSIAGLSMGASRSGDLIAVALDRCAGFAEQWLSSVA